MRVNVINLDRSADRLAEFMAVNGHLAISRFPAVDGEQLDISSLIDRGIFTQPVLEYYSLGAVGCAMSHVALWDLAIESGQNVTLAEDDAIFNPAFEGCANELIKTLPANWDFILWGWNFDDPVCFEMLPGVSHCLARFEVNRMRSNIRSFQEQCVSSRPFKLLWACGIPSYTISPKGACSLKNNLLPLRPLRIPHPDADNPSQFATMGIDMALNSIYRHLNAFVCFPPLVITKNEVAKSTIQVSEDALPKWDRVLRDDPYDSGALNNQALILRKLMRPEEAIATYDRALAIQPRHPVILRNRGFVLFEQKRFEEALATYDNILAILPRDLEALRNRGAAFHALKHFEEAIASYDQVLAIEPEDFLTLRNRNNAMVARGRFEEALGSYDKALAIRPEDVETLSSCAFVFYKLNRLQEAIASYNRALAINPDHKQAVRGLTIACRTLFRTHADDNP